MERKALLIVPLTSLDLKRPNSVTTTEFPITHPTDESIIGLARPNKEVRARAESARHLRQEGDELGFLERSQVQVDFKNCTKLLLI